MTESQHFLKRMIAAQIAQGKLQRLVTRFPPEPNGCLHIGHAKSLCLNFGLVREFGGHCTMRLDDTNPRTGDEDHIASIQEDVRWLGFDWGEHLRHASDYFEQLLAFARQLIAQGAAYVDDQSLEAIRQTRGDLTTPGVASPHRSRSVAENQQLFQRMCLGEFAEGSRVLRAKIDMASGNMHLRDPVLYRIRFAAHPRTAKRYCVYPMYDFAHTLSDAIEGVTHSLCTMEFEDHRPLYEWILDQLPGKIGATRPRQYEFSRMSLDYTVMSKRHLKRLIENETVTGWDDPRMPTLKGMRRRGIPPEAILDFIQRIGLSKDAQRVQPELLDYCVRQALDPVTPRALAVLRPLKVVIHSLQDEDCLTRSMPWHPQKPEMGTQSLPMGAELFMDADDFRLEAPASFRRLRPGGLVRLRYGCVIRCDDVDLDTQGNPVTLHCSHDPESFDGQNSSWGKVRGIIHWIDALASQRASVRVYQPLFSCAEPLAMEQDALELLNPESLVTLSDARVSHTVAACAAGSRFQFERLGYFSTDSVEHVPSHAPVFNRIVTLRDGGAFKGG